MNLKKHIPSKKAFDEACAIAAAECPQVQYKPYLELTSTWGKKDKSRKALITYWANNSTLWESGYYEFLPDDVYKVLAKWKRF